MTRPFHHKRNPGAGTAGALEIVNLGQLDGSNIIPSGCFNQAVSRIARRARVSRAYASVLAEIMGVRR